MLRKYAKTVLDSAFAPYSAGLTIVVNIAIAMGLAVLCVEFVLRYIQGWTLESRCPRKTLKKGALYFTYAMQKLYSLKPTEFPRGIESIEVLNFKICFQDLEKSMGFGQNVHKVLKKCGNYNGKYIRGI